MWTEIHDTSSLPKQPESKILSLRRSHLLPFLYWMCMSRQNENENLLKTCSVITIISPAYLKIVVIFSRIKRSEILWIFRAWIVFKFIDNLVESVVILLVRWMITREKRKTRLLSSNDKYSKDNLFSAITFLSNSLCLCLSLSICVRMSRSWST